LNDGQFIALSYPISIVGANNSVITISNNSQFENAIKYAIDNCPENSNTSLDFSKVISSNSWKISYFYDETEKLRIMLVIRLLFIQIILLLL